MSKYSCIIHNCQLQGQWSWCIAYSFCFMSLRYWSKQLQGQLSPHRMIARLYFFKKAPSFEAREPTGMKSCRLSYRQKWECQKIVATTSITCHHIQMSVCLYALNLNCFVQLWFPLEYVFGKIENLSVFLLLLLHG